MFAPTAKDDTGGKMTLTDNFTNTHADAKTDSGSDGGPDCDADAGTVGSAGVSLPKESDASPDDEERTDVMSRSSMLRMQYGDTDSDADTGAGLKSDSEYIPSKSDSGSDSAYIPDYEQRTNVRSRSSRIRMQYGDSTDSDADTDADGKSVSDSDSDLNADTRSVQNCSMKKMLPAPQFFPTVEEFSDPIAYIESIREKG